MRKNKKTLIKVSLAVVLAAFLIYFIYSLISGGVDMVKTALDTKPDTKVLNKEYASLFNRNAYSRIVIDKVKRSKGRNDIALLNIDSLRLVVCKIDSKGGSLESNVVVKNETTSNSTEVVYKGVNERFFTFLHASPRPPIAEKLLLTIDGNSIDTVASNDSLLNLYAHVRRFSISYMEGGKNDFYFTTDDNSFSPPCIPISILFLKRGNAIYFILMAPSFPPKSVPPQLLLSIIDKGKE